MCLRKNNFEILPKGTSYYLPWTSNNKFISMSLSYVVMVSAPEIFTFDMRGYELKEKNTYKIHVYVIV